MTTSIQIDQDRPAAPPSLGTPGVSRDDLWLTEHVHLSINDLPPGIVTYYWEFLDLPPGSAADMLDPGTGLVDRTVAAPYFVPDISTYTYRIACTLTVNGRPYQYTILGSATKDAAGVDVNRAWRYPAYGETGVEANFSGGVRGSSVTLETILTDILLNGFGGFGISAGVPVAGSVVCGGIANAGAAGTWSRSDHIHPVLTDVPIDMVVGDTSDSGASARFCRADHAHGIPVSAPVSVGTANALGDSGEFCHSNHVHEAFYQIIQNAASADQTKRHKLQFTGTAVTSVADDAGNNRTIVTLTAGGSYYQTVQNAGGVDQTQRGKVQFTGTAVTSVADDAGNNRTIVTLDSGGGGGTFDAVTETNATIVAGGTFYSAAPTVTAAAGKTTHYEARAVIRDTAGGNGAAIIRQFAVSDNAGTFHFVGGGASPISGTDLYSEADVGGGVYDLEFALVAGTGVITAKAKGNAAGSARIMIGEVVL